MRITRARLVLLTTVALLAGCAYPPVLQRSYQFERHPGVFLETWTDYYGYMTTTLINRGNVNKCAWTDALDSRLLRPGESWQVGQVQSPGNVIVTNVMPWDPNCLKAKSEQTAPR
jgi:hypothetical protein